MRRDAPSDPAPLGDGAAGGAVGGGDGNGDDSVGTVRALLNSTVEQERECEAELQRVQSAASAASTALAERMREAATLAQQGHREMLQLLDAVEHECAHERRASREVRRLDTQLRRAEAALRRVENLLALRACTDGVRSALAAGDTDAACKHVEHFLALQTDSAQTRGDDGGSGSDGAASSVQINASIESLRGDIRKRAGAIVDDSSGSDGGADADERKYAKQRAAILTEARRLKQVGLANEALDVILRFMCRRLSALFDASAAAGQHGESAAARSIRRLTALYEGVAGIVSEYESLLRTHFGGGSAVQRAVLALEEQCSARGTRMMEEYADARRVTEILRRARAARSGATGAANRAAASSASAASRHRAHEFGAAAYDVDSFYYGGGGGVDGAVDDDVDDGRVARDAHSSASSSPAAATAVDIHEVDAILDEIAVVSRRTAMYKSFLLSRCSGTRGARHARQQLQHDALDVAVQELLGSYVGLEEYYMQENMRKAEQIERSPTLTWSASSAGVDGAGSNSGGGGGGGGGTFRKQGGNSGTGDDSRGDTTRLGGNSGSGGGGGGGGGARRLGEQPGVNARVANGGNSVREQVTSTVVEDVFFVLKKCVQRATSAHNIDTLCAVNNNMNALLAGPFKQLLSRRVRESAPAATLISAQLMLGNEPKRDAYDALLVAVNNAQLSAEYCDKLRGSIEQSVAADDQSADCRNSDDNDVNDDSVGSDEIGGDGACLAYADRFGKSDVNDGDDAAFCGDAQQRTRMTFSGGSSDGARGRAQQQRRQQHQQRQQQQRLAPQRVPDRVKISPMLSEMEDIARELSRNVAGHGLDTLLSVLTNTVLERGAAAGALDDAQLLKYVLSENEYAAPSAAVHTLMQAMSGALAPIAAERDKLIESNWDGVVRRLASWAARRFERAVFGTLLRPARAAHDGTTMATAAAAATSSFSASLWRSTPQRAATSDDRRNAPGGDADFDGSGSDAVAAAAAAAAPHDDRNASQHRRFNALGALAFDADVRTLSQYFTHRARRVSVRDAFTRLAQVAMLLGVDKPDEVYELWGDEIRLDAEQVKRVLALRTDFKASAIRALRLPAGNSSGGAGDSSIGASSGGVHVRA